MADLDIETTASGLLIPKGKAVDLFAATEASSDVVRVAEAALMRRDTIDTVGVEIRELGEGGRDG